MMHEVEADVIRIINDKIDALCNKYQIIYLDITDIINNKTVNNKEITEQESYLIFEKLKKTLEF